MLLVNISKVYEHCDKEEPALSSILSGDICCVIWCFRHSKFVRQGKLSLRPRLLLAPCSRIDPHQTDELT